jgi:hypothetical protein
MPYTVYRVEKGMPDMIIGVTQTPNEASGIIEEDRQWLGREASYRWNYEGAKRDDTERIDP